MAIVELDILRQKTRLIHRRIRQMAAFLEYGIVRWTEKLGRCRARNWPPIVFPRRRCRWRVAWREFLCNSYKTFKENYKSGISESFKCVLPGVQISSMGIKVLALNKIDLDRT